MSASRGWKKNGRPDVAHDRVLVSQGCHGGYDRDSRPSLLVYFGMDHPEEEALDINLRRAPCFSG